MMWIALSVGVLLLLLPLLIGLGLPSRQQVTRVELLKAPTAEVWEALNNLQAQTQWRQDLQSVQMLDDDAGLRWLEKASRGAPATLRKLKETPQQELVLEIHQGSSRGTRQARLNSVPGGTRVTFTAVQETSNPLARLAARQRGGLDARLDQFIQQLKQHFAA